MQNEHHPLLTIAIPTYNRSAYLAELLDVLVPQLLGESRVELFISDNASPDKTSDLIDSFRQNGLQLTYSRNSENIGSDRNFLKCFREARGKYVWIVGDDDIIPDGSIRRILHFLEFGDFDLVYLRASEFQDRPAGEFSLDPHGRHALKIYSASRFCRMIGNMFTLTTCNIINKQRFLQCASNPDDGLVGTNLVQLGWTYPLLKEFRCGLIVYDHVVFIRAANRGGYAVSRVFGRNFKMITDQVLGPDSALGQIMHQDILTICLPFLVHEVRRQTFGDFTSENFHAELEPIYGSMKRYWLYVFPIATFPLWAAELWFRAVRLLNLVSPAARLIIFRLAGPSENQIC